MSEKKFKLGYTAGVFDMFHVGHLRLLERAKQQCERLIVAVSTDELVESYKNKKTIIPFDERVEIVSAIRYVDEVVPQENRDKKAAFDRYGFDAMFVGSDWLGSEIFEEVDRYMRERGGQVVYLSHTDGVSSTMLREKIKD